MPRATSSPVAPMRARRAERGSVLLFALITLVALMLGTLGLIRSVDTGAMLLGNIGFKQDATSSADRVTRQAIQWLAENRLVLNTDIVQSGYYASTQEFGADGITPRPPVDATGKQLHGNANRQLIDWDNNNCRAAESGSYNGCGIRPASVDAVNGNTASYVVFRLCSKAGDYTTDTSISCAQPMNAASGSGGTKGDINYVDTDRLEQASGPYYRIVVRVMGARNTASFTETIVHF